MNTQLQGKWLIAITQTPLFTFTRDGLPNIHSEGKARLINEIITPGNSFEDIKDLLIKELSKWIDENVDFSYSNNLVVNKADGINEFQHTIEYTIKEREKI
jgi:hypothetical protein